MIAIARPAGDRWFYEVALSAVIATAAVFAFWAPLSGMVALWGASPMYSYGYSVPIVSAYLVWASRARLAGVRPQPARMAGAVVLATATAMAIAGHAGSVQMLGQLAFLVAVVGIVLWLLGFDHLRITWPAIAYLLLMVPVWDAFTEPLHWPFQNQSAVLSMSMLRAIGVPVHREGTFLALPGITLEVARACSGVNYLIAVLALGLPLSYLYLTSMWRRVALLLFALTIAAFSNALRVTLIGILAYLDIGSPLHGPFHVLHGLFVAGIGYAALFAGLHWLGSPASARPSADASPVVVRQDPWRLPRLEAVALTALFLALGSGVFAKESQSVGLAAGLDQLPATIAGWEWDRSASVPSRAEWPGADVELRRKYRHRDGTSADVYVGYFATQHQDKELANTRAEALHRRSQLVRVGDPTAGSFAANRVESDDATSEAIFWYELDGVQTSSITTRLYTLWHAIVRGRTNGAVVLLASPSTQGGGATTSARLQLLAFQVRQALAGLLSNVEAAGLGTAAANP